jgi:PERQ amino acid-rich with GYF domain-containing protein
MPLGYSPDGRLTISTDARFHHRSRNSSEDGSYFVRHANSSLFPSRSRRDNRSTNGTLTFRRSSNAPHIQPSQAESLPTPSVEASEDVPPPPNPSYDQSVPADLRYSKARLLDMYKAHRESKDSGASNGDVSRLFEDGWNPGHSNGTNGRAWGKTTDGRETFGPDACWDMNGSQRLISLEEMTDEEKNVSRFPLLLFSGFTLLIVYASCFLPM